MSNDATENMQSIESKVSIFDECITIIMKILKDPAYLAISSPIILTLLGYKIYIIGDDYNYIYTNKLTGYANFHLPQKDYISIANSALKVISFGWDYIFFYWSTMLIAIAIMGIPIILINITICKCFTRVAQYALYKNIIDVLFLIYLTVFIYYAAILLFDQAKRFVPQVAQLKAKETIANALPVEIINKNHPAYTTLPQDKQLYFLMDTPNDRIFFYYTDKENGIIKRYYSDFDLKFREM